MNRPLRLLASAALAAFAGVASARSAPDLVVVADPTVSEALAPGREGAVTLAYHVVEVLQGEAGSGSLIVRHESLTDEERRRLADRERVILIARRDPETAGRWVAPPPLRATPSALAAFRKWSAPEDVRSPRPVEDVVAEVRASSAESDEEAVIAEEPATAPPRPEPPAVVEESLEARREVPARAAAAETPVRAAKAEPSPAPPARPAWDPPLLIGADVQPEDGPGLPPAPPAGALGPPVHVRDDLRSPPRGRRR